jgi:Domain of unknown function (DUF4157)
MLAGCSAQLGRVRWRRIPRPRRRLRPRRWSRCSRASATRRSDGWSRRSSGWGRGGTGSSARPIGWPMRSCACWNPEWCSASAPSAPPRRRRSGRGPTRRRRFACGQRLRPSPRARSLRRRPPQRGLRSAPWAPAALCRAPSEPCSSPASAPTSQACGSTRMPQPPRALGARAFTLGHDIAFAPGQRAPGRSQGDRLMAHELAHVVQQRQGACPELQRSALNDYNDRDVMHDPSKLTDAQIEATREFKSYMNSDLPWQWQHHMTREEALLACRLILRRLREGSHVDWQMEAAYFMIRARRQLGTLREAERLVGELQHVHLGRPDFERPGTSISDFAKWLLANGPEPTNISRMNCWEMVLFAAFRSNIRSKAQVKKLYTKARDELARSQNPVAVLENELCGASFNLTFATNPRTGVPRFLSPEPLLGDIIIFDIFETHVAISLGTTTSGGDHLVISLHQNRVVRTTIEDLIPRFVDPATGAPLRPTPTLCRDPWRGQ